MRTMKTGMRIRDTVRAVAVIMLLTITQTTSAQQTDPALTAAVTGQTFTLKSLFDTRHSTQQKILAATGIEEVQLQQLHAIEEKVEKKGNSYKLIFVDGKKRTTYYLNIQERQDKDPRVDLRINMDGDAKGFNNLNGIMDFFGSDANEIKNYRWSLDSIRDMMRNSDLTPGQIVTELKNRGYTVDQIRQMREQVSKGKQKK